MEIKLLCVECGEEITNTVQSFDGDGFVLEITPCSKCLQTAYERGQLQESLRHMGE
jgi:hypothetical protein